MLHPMLLLNIQLYNVTLLNAHKDEEKNQKTKEKKTAILNDILRGKKSWRRGKKERVEDKTTKENE